MADNAMLMIHAPWTYAYGNAAQLREQADVIDKWAEAMATSYAPRRANPPTTSWHSSPSNSKGLTFSTRK
jgi:ATP-dependent protease ClpP protease subunit